jgi:hypothetical protein
MLGKFHIHQNGLSLCHAGEGYYISFEAAAGMNPKNCCEDCRRRYLNLAKMLNIPGTMTNTIDKALLREKTNCSF